jgi:hypothetical protein
VAIGFRPDHPGGIRPVGYGLRRVTPYAASLSAVLSAVDSVDEPAQRATASLFGDGQGLIAIPFLERM